MLLFIILWLKTNRSLKNYFNNKMLSQLKKKDNYAVFIEIKGVSVVSTNIILIDGNIKNLLSKTSSGELRNSVR